MTTQEGPKLLSGEEFQSIVGAVNFADSVELEVKASAAMKLIGHIDAQAERIEELESALDLLICNTRLALIDDKEAEEKVVKAQEIRAAHKDPK